MEEYRNDPNKFSRYASLIYPEKMEETPENWFARALREDREARQDREPVQFADTSGGVPDFTSGMPDVGPLSRPENDATTVTSLMGNKYRNVWGPDSLGVTGGESKEENAPDIVRAENKVSDTATPAPGSDPLRGSMTINQPLPQPPEPPAKTYVDRKFMRFVENRDFIAKVPIKTDGNPYPNSGATVAIGFDLGQWGKKDLQKLGLTDNHELLRRFEPYLGRKGDDAVQFLKENPLRISEQEADWIDDTLLAKKVNDLNSHFAKAPGNKDKILFTDLPPDIQTVVYSVAHHKGTGGYGKSTDLNNAVFNKDRQKVVELLVKEGMEATEKGIAQRRFKEAVYLYDKYAGGVTP